MSYLPRRSGQELDIKASSAIKRPRVGQEIPGDTSTRTEPAVTDAAAQRPNQTADTSKSCQQLLSHHFTSVCPASPPPTARRTLACGHRALPLLESAVSSVQSANFIHANGVRGRSPPEGRRSRPGFALASVHPHPTHSSSWRILTQTLLPQDRRRSGGQQPICEDT